MKIFHKYFLLLFSIFFILNSYEVFSQVEKENDYKRLKTNLENEEKKSDSLNNVLKQKVNFISIEKSKPDFDKNEIKKLLSNTSTLTNAIEKKQLEIDRLNKKYTLVKAELYIIYSTQIDSINQSNLSKNEKSNLTTRLIEKRLLVSPKIDMLTFEPEKVIKIVHSENVIEQKIYREFLFSAFSEIESKLAETKELKQEIETILTLNKETSAFLEEAEFDNDISYFKSNIKTINPSSTAALSDGSFSNENSLRTQTKSFSKILNQLENNKLPKNQSYSIGNIIQKKDLMEFKKLINQVEQQLIDYKTVVENKLKNF